MKYTERQHRHNFAIWAACRATQRGFASVAVLRQAAEGSTLEAFSWRPTRLGAFDEQHKKWCAKICSNLEHQGIFGATYGRAAKLVNVYLKSALVLRDLSSQAAKVIHPPVDRILLSNVAKILDIEPSVRKLLRSTRWTQMDEGRYFEVIEALREVNGDHPFWTIEEYWTITEMSR
jgi:hypothetical protein